MLSRKSDNIIYETDIFQVVLPLGFKADCKYRIEYPIYDHVIKVILYFPEVSYRRTLVFSVDELVRVRYSEMIPENIIDQFKQDITQILKIKDWSL